MALGALQLHRMPVKGVVVSLLACTATMIAIILVMKQTPSSPPIRLEPVVVPESRPPALSAAATAPSSQRPPEPAGEATGVDQAAADTGREMLDALRAVGLEHFNFPSPTWFAPKLGAPPKAYVLFAIQLYSSSHRRAEEAVKKLRPDAGDEEKRQLAWQLAKTEAGLKLFTEGRTLYVGRDEQAPLVHDTEDVAYIRIGVNDTTILAEVRRTEFPAFFELKRKPPAPRPRRQDESRK